MADPRFFQRAGPYTLRQIAEITGAVLADLSSATIAIVDVAALQDAEAGRLSFLDNRKYINSFRTTRATACFVRSEIAIQAPPGLVCLLTPNPYKAYAQTAQAFYPEPIWDEYRAASAVIHPTAQIGERCFIDHGVIIGRNVKLGAGCRIHPYAVINDGVEIGESCEIGAHAYLTHCLIGDRVRLYPSVCIGRPGFGFALDARKFISVPQLGRVLIENDVEIGAHTTVDRGAGPDTVIGAGTRIDNLVQIGHNVQIGRMCIIVAQTGISGSTQLGDGVMTGGQAGLAGHLKIGAGAKIAAQSGINRDVPAGVEVMGSPAFPLKKYMRQVAMLSRMSDKKGTPNDD